MAPRHEKSIILVIFAKISLIRPFLYFLQKMRKNQPKPLLVPRFPEEQFLQNALPTPKISHIWCLSSWLLPAVGGYSVFVTGCFVIALAPTCKKCLRPAIKWLLFAGFPLSPFLFSRAIFIVHRFHISLASLIFTASLP